MNFLKIKYYEGLFSTDEIHIIAFFLFVYFIQIWISL